MSFEERVNCCGYLLSNLECDQFKIYLQNLKYWDNAILPSDIVKSSQDFIAINKIQRAIDEIGNYYKRNFNLKDIMEFEKIPLQLKEIQNQKKEHKNWNSNEAFEKLVVVINSWIRCKTKRQQPFAFDGLMINEKVLRKGAFSITGMRKYLLYFALCHSVGI